MLVRVYEDQALSMKFVYKWLARFQEGRESVSDNPRRGRLAISVSDENIGKVSFPPGGTTAFQLLHSSINHQVANMVAKNDANLAQSPTFRYVSIES
ncbi:hypothetical protein TNCV_2985771 [Trichonephila clavipes]|nr:hypothetical protein TNCV_2985771 [Trichonephila clavipes]